MRTVSPGRPITSLDIGLRQVVLEPKHDHVAAFNITGPESIDELVDEDSFLISECRHHAGSFDLDRLVEEQDGDNGNDDAERQIPQPKQRPTDGVAVAHAGYGQLQATTTNYIDAIGINWLAAFGWAPREADYASSREVLTD
jgi:hypothetical protein